MPDSRKRLPSVMIKRITLAAAVIAVLLSGGIKDGYAAYGPFYCDSSCTVILPRYTNTADCVPLGYPIWYNCIYSPTPDPNSICQQIVGDPDCGQSEYSANNSSLPVMATDFSQPMPEMPDYLAFAFVLTSMALVWYRGRRRSS